MVRSMSGRIFKDDLAPLPKPIGHLAAGGEPRVKGLQLSQQPGIEVSPEPFGPMTSVMPEDRQHAAKRVCVIPQPMHSHANVGSSCGCFDRPQFLSSSVTAVPRIDAVNRQFTRLSNECRRPFGNVANVVGGRPPFRMPP